MTDVVVDASAIVAIIKGEPGAERAMADGHGGRISSLNYCEVVSWLAERGAHVRHIEEVMGAFNLAVEAFDRPRAMAAGSLAVRTRRRSISLADRACLALAMELGVPVVTGDRAWLDLGLAVEVRVFR